jgi:FkbH-like protein
MIQNKVKLVIWDLDETFWGGTLAEEGMTPVAANAETVRELSRRGIINSICSKNDYETAKSKLVELGIWGYFVFPAISFNPKGQAIAQMIEEAALRAENVLFIDDNPSNLEEVKFFNPGIMTAHPADVLETLLDHEHLAGKPDPELTRLKQYQFLQKKVEERSTTSLSNDEFLRTSNIRVTIDYDVEANFDRVVELINRTNQLNYTKVRLEDPVSLKRFRRSLGSFGYNSGCVWVRDSYGDYGLVGFFMLKRRAGQKRLQHFLFSCRTMNMGIEQYVYEMLDRPDVDIVKPVSYPPVTHKKVDWINVEDVQQGQDKNGKDSQLLLLGGCDLLQLASYCSTNRLEFVNKARGDVVIRYDDTGFILGDREAIRENNELLPTWTCEDAVRFDEGVATSDLILLCMYGAKQGSIFEINGKVQFRITPSSVGAAQESHPDAFRNNMHELDLDQAERERLILKSFDMVAQRAKPDARIFVIGYPTLAVAKEKKAAKRGGFNNACRDYCEDKPRFKFMDVDRLIPREELLNDRHFSPAGYFILAKHILTEAGMWGPALSATSKPPAASKEAIAPVARPPITQRERA